MKILYSSIFIIAATLVFLLAYRQAGFQKEKNQNIVLNEGGGDQESPIERAQWENARYADPATGEIPSMGIWKAYQQLIADGKIKDGAFTSSASTRGEGWQLINDFFPSIAITKLTYDPNHTQTFYFCSGEGWYNADAAIGAGVFKTDDGGNTWNQLSSTANSDFNYCQDVDVHPITSDVYVATLAAGLQRSKDGGLTWQKVLSPVGNPGICDVEFTKNGGIFASVGIFAGGGIYYSENGDSATWVKQTNGFPTTGIYRVELATAASDDNVAYAVACKSSDYSINGIYKTVDKGNTWTQVSTPGGSDTMFAHFQAWYDLVLAVDPNDANTLVGGGWHFWRTRDGGDSWQKLTHGKSDSAGYQYVHVDEHAIVFRNSDTVYFGCDGGIWKSGNFTNDFPNIYERNYGYRVTQYYAGDMHPAAGDVGLIGGTQDNGSTRLGYAGISPNQRLSGYDGAYCAINQTKPSIMYTSKNSNGIFRWKNYGYEIPDTITNPYLTDANVQFINPLALDVADKDILNMGSNKGLWRLSNASTANKSEWTQATFTTSGITAIASSKSKPHTVFIGRNSSGNIYRIEGADTTGSTYLKKDCDPSNQLPNSFCASIWVDPLDVNHVLATYSNYGIKNIWESYNAASAGTTWQNQDGDLPNLPVNWIVLHPVHHEVAYIGTDLGVFYTNKLLGDSTVWLPSNTGLANVRVSMLLLRENDLTLTAITHGRGMFQATAPMDGPDFSVVWNERGPLDVGGRTRAIMVDPNDATGQTIWAGAVSGGLWKTTFIDALPTVGIADVNISGNEINIFPNPISASGTNIIFSITQSQTVSVFIFNGEGKKVATLLENINTTEGKHQLHWMPNANDANGIYYVNFISGNLPADRYGEKVVKKIVYLK
ncbi:MAG: T9SS type A sorting domain-containing protein [Chitinophagales bacterium]|nr:T9SS type A sorting domain-containing protein [Chitinophagales bacterium]